MNIKYSIAMLLAGGMLAGSAVANEVVLTHGQGANRLALDFVASGDATAFEFELALPKGSRNIDTSKCLAELPATHTGACKFNPDTGNVVVIVYSNDNRPLPAGIVSLGWIQAPGGQAPLVQKLLVSDTTGRSLPVSVSGQADDSGRRSERAAEKISER